MLPLTAGIGDGAVQLMSTLGSAVISELDSIGVALIQAPAALAPPTPVAAFASPGGLPPPAPPPNPHLNPLAAMMMPRAAAAPKLPRPTTGERGSL